MRVTRRPRRSIVAALVILAPLAGGPWGPHPTAGALGVPDRAGDTGATSRISGDRIVTTITGRRTTSGSGRRVVRSYWVTYTAAQIAYILQVASVTPRLSEHPVIREFTLRSIAGTADDLTIQYRVVDGRATADLRIVDLASTATSAWSRQMVTVVPPLRPTLTPPGGLAVPVTQPVFVSYTPTEWGRVVERTLSSGGVSARVRAWPVRFEARSGDPAALGQVVRCSGPGRPFDPRDPASPAHQSRRPGTCTLSYRSRTGVPGRPVAWVGDVTVWWWAEWSTDGRTWRPLGEIPRLTPLPRAVREVPTALAARP